jgi:hypothetical protein
LELEVLAELVDPHSQVGRFSNFRRAIVAEEFGKTIYVAFFCFAHLVFCAAAIFRLVAADTMRRFCWLEVSDFDPAVFAFFTLAHLALAAAAIRARPAAEIRRGVVRLAEDLDAGPSSDSSAVIA